MKLLLDQRFVEQLSLIHKPIKQDDRGGLIYDPEPSNTPYIVCDAHNNSPVGFGVKIGAASKTYIIQRNIHGRVLKIKVGNVNDFETLN
ncbi:hypothetical protein [Thiobacillus sp.]